MATRRGHGEGMIRQRADGLWEARISLGHADGKRKRKSIYGKTWREVAEKLKALHADQQKGLPISTSERPTLGQFLEHWLSEVARPALRASTYTTYESHINKHTLPALGRTPLQQLTPQQVQSFINKKSASGLAPRT